VQYVQPFLSHYGVHAYFCGHDHLMEHLDYDGVEYFVTGASTMNGAIEDEGNTAANLTWAGENFSGFSRVLATAEELTVDFLDYNGTMVYSHSQYNYNVNPTGIPTMSPTFSPTTSAPSSAPSSVPTIYVTHSFCDDYPDHYMCQYTNSYNKASNSTLNGGTSASDNSGDDDMSEEEVSGWYHWVIAVLIAVPFVPLSLCIYRTCFYRNDNDDWKEISSSDVVDINALSNQEVIETHEQDSVL